MACPLVQWIYSKDNKYTADLKTITEKFKKYYDCSNFNQNNKNINNINMNEQQNQNEGRILVINPGDFSKDTLFASVNPSTLESNIYNLK